MPLTSGLGWPLELLINVFLHGLADHIRDLLIAYPRPPVLYGMLIYLTNEVDQQLLNRRHHSQVSPHSGRQPRVPVTSAATSVALTALTEPRHKPMQLGGSALTPGERRRQQQLSLCLCGGKGHFCASCLGKGQDHQQNGRYEGVKLHYLPNHDVLLSEFPSFCPGALMNWSRWSTLGPTQTSSPKR